MASARSARLLVSGSATAIACPIDEAEMRGNREKIWSVSLKDVF
jgi:hypothetical protein